MQKSSVGSSHVNFTAPVPVYTVLKGVRAYFLSTIVVILFIYRVVI